MHPSRYSKKLHVSGMLVATAEGATESVEDCFYSTAE
jgi:hypothetical protein